jgi:hypothetical protein
MQQETKRELEVESAILLANLRILAAATGNERRVYL